MCAASGIDVLVNNAGVMAFADEATADGLDVQMQTNHTSHFLLTKLCMPLLEKAAELRGEARVVNHSSALRAMTEKGWDNHLKKAHLGKNGGNLGGNGQGICKGPDFQRYQQTKLANVVFTYALADRLAAKGSRIKATVAHPGVAPTSLHVNSMAGGNATPPVPFWFLRFFVKTALMQSMADGTMGILRCACGEEVHNYDFYGPLGSPKAVSGVHDEGEYRGEAVLKKKEPLADAAARALLWEESEAAIGERFVV